MRTLLCPRKVVQVGRKTVSGPQVPVVLGILRSSNKHLFVGSENRSAMVMQFQLFAGAGADGFLGNKWWLSLRSPSMSAIAIFRQLRNQLANAEHTTFPSPLRRRYKQNALPFGTEWKGITVFRHLSQRTSRYCLSYTEVLLNFLPCGSVPLAVAVRVLPSADTTTRPVIVTIPPFWIVNSNV
jgi:hypothetical protein